MVLGSATPSLESLQNALEGRYRDLRLTSRAGGARTAPLQLVDVSAEVLPEFLSPAVEQRMAAHLDNGNQVLVFVNRRGYAPILNCLRCGWQSECENCVALMTVHSTPRGLRCHHCGEFSPVPPACPVCASRDLVTFGAGTQKLEESLACRFPGVPVLRIDRDSTRRKHALDEKLQQVASEQPCILVGTQMLAKGHHFPGITLVVVPDADSGLFSADFRGAEQMSQLLVQVAGRAGRAEKPGEVMLQTRHGNHPLFQTLRVDDYRGHARALLAERQGSGMPPFSNLCLLKSEADSFQAGMNFLKTLAAMANSLTRTHGLAIDQWGPLPAPMEKRSGRYRCQLYLRSNSRRDLHGLMSVLCEKAEELKLPRGLRWQIDVDPQDLV